jgi:2,3-bisphosphoglycerate-independent phosphoglycerate mutase
LARLLGLEVVVDTNADLDRQVRVLEENWDRFDFFFLHYKYTDSTGEDGDFDGKVRRIEELDQRVSHLVRLGPDVLIVTGDHSTPSRLQSHSWHPVPVLLASPSCRPDRVDHFGETACLQGGLGQLEAKYLMPLAMAHARRLQKFGA